MKKYLIATLIAVCGAATAGGYQAESAKIEFCNAQAEMSSWMFTLKQRGRSKDEELGKLTKGGFFSGNSRSDDIGMYGVNYAFDKATDKDDAAKTTWAYCMDRL